MNFRRFKNILWKELLDLIRDRRTVLATIIMPIIFYPALGGLIGYVFRAQPVYIAYIDQDGSQYSKKLLDILKENASNTGNYYVFSNYTHPVEALTNPNIDIVIIIPKGFGNNISSSLEGVSTVILKFNVASTKSGEALNFVSSALHTLSTLIVKERVRRFAPNIDIKSFLNPVESKLELVGPGGRKARPEERFLYLTLMILVLGLYFSMHPAISFVADSITGEKERRTLEALLVTPASRLEILTGKLVASLTLSGTAAAMNTIGVFLMYFMLFSGLAGIPITFAGGLGLISIYAITVFLTITVTVAITLIISVMSRSIRVAHSNSVAVVTALALVLFASLYGDIEKIASTLLPILYLIPYTHSVLALTTYVKYGLLYSVKHLLVLVFYTMMLLILGAKLFTGERMLITPTRKRIQ